MRHLLITAVLLAAAPASAQETSRRSEMDLVGGARSEDAPEATLEAGLASPDAVELPPVGGPSTTRLQEALDRLVQVELALAGQGGGAAPMVAELDEVRRMLQSLLVESARCEERSQRPPAPATPGAAATWAPARVDSLARRIDETSFTADKMQLLRDEVADGRLSAEQAGLLVERFAFSRDRVEALVFLHPRIVDPENFAELLSSLKFASDRESVRAQLGLPP